MQWLWIIPGVLVLALVLIYNGLIVKKNRVDNAFSTIDVMLKKRYDLIPNLVSTVKGYSEHERSTLEEVTRLRQQAMSSASTEQRIATDNLLSGVLSRLIATVENYPELKASDHFMSLQRSLSEIEEQLSASRRAYNAAVTGYNTSIELFPTSLLAGTMGFGRRTLLEALARERSAPSIREALADDSAHS